jgi:hypothetical protein
MIRIPVDFNTMQQFNEDKVIIPTHLSSHNHLLSIIQPHIRVVIYEEDDFEVEAIVLFDETHRLWVAIPDWSTQRSLPYQ